VIRHRISQKEELQQWIQTDRQTGREMYVKPYERENLMDVEAYRLHKQLYVYVSPVIIIVGVVGNLLSFIVLVQRPFRHISTYCYLIVLAVADTVVLTAGLLPKWIEQVGLRPHTHCTAPSTTFVKKLQCTMYIVCHCDP